MRHPVSSLSPIKNDEMTIQLILKMLWSITVLACRLLPQIDRMERKQQTPEGEGPMNCPKCRGLMYSERVSDFSLTFYAWKCVNCGALIDQTILANQYKRKRTPIARLAAAGGKKS
jgi:hypothetical protein